MKGGLVKHRILVTHESSFSSDFDEALQGDAFYPWYKSQNMYFLIGSLLFVRFKPFEITHELIDECNGLLYVPVFCSLPYLFSHSPRDPTFSRNEELRLGLSLGFHAVSGAFFEGQL